MLGISKDAGSDCNAKIYGTRAYFCGLADAAATALSMPYPASLFGIASFMPSAPCCPSS